MITEEVKAKIKEIEGAYTFRSPYHNGNVRLPFTISGCSYNPDFPVQCSTVEYKGWSKSYIDTGYQLEAVLSMIERGFLKKKHQA